MRVFCDWDGHQQPAGGLDGRTPSAPVRINGPRSIIAFASLRGGSGKSTLVANVAGALALAGAKVGIFDADLNAPGIFPLLGVKPFPLPPGSGGLDPATGPLGLRVVAANLLPEGEAPPISFIDDDSVAIAGGQNGLVVLGNAATLARMAMDARFGNLDLLLIDLASGLEHIYRATRLFALDALILVGTPAGRDVPEIAGITNGVQVFGTIENMTSFNCDKCHSVRPMFSYRGEAPAGITLLARLPFDPHISECAARGTLFIKEYVDSPVARLISELAIRIRTSVAACVAHETDDLTSAQK
jgi:Mrp family chromosome partitioning ATPase